MGMFDFDDQYWPTSSWTPDLDESTNPQQGLAIKTDDPSLEGNVSFIRRTDGRVQLHIMTATEGDSGILSPEAEKLLTTFFSSPS